MTISVIIATRDRSALLRSTLEALSKQHPAGCPFEIVIVDNGSVDDTTEVVEAAARRGAPIVYIYEPASGKSRALNTAVTRARGDVLILTDDDVLPSPGWIAAYAKTFETTEADFAVGRILPQWEAPPPRWLSSEIYGVLAIPDGGTDRLPIAKGVNEHIMPLGANMAVRRRVLDRIGGWNPDLGKLQGTLRTGEDHEFALKMVEAGFAGVYEPDAAVLHRVPPDRLRFAYFRRWFHHNGIIEAALEDEYPTTARYLLNVPRYLWRRFVTDVFATAVAVLSVNVKRAAAGAMRIWWFAGYLRGRWKRRSWGGVRTAPVAIPRS